eukprot:216910_1
MCAVILLLNLVALCIINAQQTSISIEGENFYINGEKTYSNATYSEVKGLLLNSRLVQGIFDDYNSSTIHNWDYPDTKKWDPTRNTNEFVSNMSKWRQNNLLAFTLGLQGGNPREPDTQPFPADWIVSAFNFTNGDLDTNYINRLSMILETADTLGMIVIVQFFYVHQISRFNGNNATIYKSIDNIINWLMKSNYKNILIEVANECNIGAWKGTILHSSAIANTIRYVQNISDHKYYVGSSYTGGHIPTNDVIEACDMVLLHGNGQSPSNIRNMINEVRSSDAYKAKNKPILFTEDEHTNFNSTDNNFEASVTNHASWGSMLTCNSDNGGDYVDDYQCPPTDWAINTNKKASFFEAVANYTKS